jgi:hypothetical protein
MKILVNRKPLLVAILLVLSTCLVGNEAFAVSEAKLTARDAALQDEFGSSVSISGDTLLVEVIHDDDANLPPYYNSGSAYVFKIADTLVRNKPMPWIPLRLLDDELGVHITYFNLH